MRVLSFFILNMTNKELRVKIYGWLFDEFGIKYEDLTSQKTKGLKKILNEFNPTQEVTKKLVKVAEEKVSDWKPYPNTK